MTIEDAIKLLKSKMDGHTDTSYEWAETVRMATKALEQKPRKGHWIEKGKIDTAYDMCGDKSWATKYMCNHCGFIHTAIENHGVYSYCPHCGADMREVEE